MLIGDARVRIQLAPRLGFALASVEYEYPKNQEHKQTQHRQPHHNFYNSLMPTDRLEGWTSHDWLFLMFRETV
jgi:hypothetical protein